MSGRDGAAKGLTIFDAAKIIDHATFTNPAQLSEGVDYTIVNGQVELDHGKLTGVTAGHFLRGRGWTAANN